MTTNNPCPMQYASCIVARYDSGVSNYQKDRTGVLLERKMKLETKNINVEDWAIRKLTPKECWRLQGFTDEDVAKCKAVGMSDTQLYRQAGNSIITNCIELLAEHLYKSQYDENYKCFDENFR